VNRVWITLQRKVRNIKMFRSKSILQVEQLYIIRHKKCLLYHRKYLATTPAEEDIKMNLINLTKNILLENRNNSIYFYFPVRLNLSVVPSQIQRKKPRQRIFSGSPGFRQDTSLILVLRWVALYYATITPVSFSAFFSL